MNPSREEALFVLALEKLPHERAAFLDAMCEGDLALRKRLEAWLAAEPRNQGSSSLSSDDPGARIEEAASQLTPTLLDETPVTEGPGTVIGRYKLLEQIGEGGFGVVYVAEQREPVKRQVALKIIKLGMDTRHVVARFEAERQALALMDHPNVAKVFDAGATESGRPFFVMELVKGIPITKYCDQQKLSTSDRLKLFIAACQAIQHAHQKGIIHRDIKPSNILVTVQEGRPVPKVIDFGIAKATQQKLTEKTLHTQLEQFIGTPAYMSPEQAEMSGLDIDTRSDIYSLGVLLYELFTGKTPFDAGDLLKSGLDEMRKIIRESEPPRPSTKLSLMGKEELTTTTQHRGAEAPKLIGLLRGDLDWIVMKCLEKDRTRRYETANGLAMDLQRHLNNEPVVARPPSAVYRLQKAWRRNRLALVAGAAVLAALTLGLIASTWQAFIATRARTTAVRAQGVAEQFRLSEMRQRQLAVESRDQAKAQEVHARRNAYVATMALAYQALQMGNLGRARELQQRAADESDLATLPIRAQVPGGADIRGWEWRYLWSQTRGDDLFVLGRHDPMAQLALWLPDGARALSAGKDGLVKLWNVDERRLLRQFSFPDRVNGLAVSPDGTRFVAGLADGHVSLWNLETFQTIWQVTLPHAVGHLTYSPDGEMVAIAGDDMISVLSSRDGSLRQSTGNKAGLHYGWRRGLAFSPDSRMLVYGSFFFELKSAIQILDLRRATQERLDRPGDSWVLTLAFSPDGRFLAAGDTSGTVTVWNWANRRIIQTLRSHSGQVVCVAFSPDGTQIASTGSDQSIKLWETKAWTETATLRGHEFEIWSVAFSPDSRRLITASKDDTVRVWKTKSVGKDLNLTFNAKTAWAASGEGTNSMLLAISADTGEYDLYKLFTGQEISAGQIEPRLVKNALAIELMPNRLAAVGFGDGHVELVDLSLQRVLWSVTNHSRAVMRLSGSAVSSSISVIYEDGWIDLLSRQTGAAQRSLQAPPVLRDPFGMCLNLSRDGERLLAAPAGGMELWLWPLQSGQPKRIQIKHREGVRLGVFSYDGKWVVTGSYDNFASLWDFDSGRELARFSGPLVGFSAAAVSHDKTRVALISTVGELSVWEPVNARQMANFSGLDGEYYSTAWDPADESIATWSSRRLLVRRAPSWEEIVAAEAKDKLEIKKP